MTRFARGTALGLIVLLLGVPACSSGSKAKKATATTTTTTRLTSTSFTITDLLNRDDQFKTFREMVALAKLDGRLGSDEVLTVFAPDTDAFNLFGTAALAPLKADPQGKLATTLTRHMVAGKHTYTDLLAANGTSLTSVAGTPLPVKVDGNRITIGGSLVKKSDILAKNGVIFVIDKVIAAPK